MSKVQVLTVDDNDMNLFVMTKFLEKGRFTFDVAVNGLEAIEKALELKPRVILMDINMPICDGIEAAREIRNRSEHYTPVIVAVTATHMLDDRSESDRGQFDHFLPKPVRPESLIELLNDTFQVDDGSAAAQTVHVQR
ncbi:MAG: response regulator [Pseudomonadota bacterium]